MSFTLQPSQRTLLYQDFGPGKGFRTIELTCRLDLLITAKMGQPPRLALVLAIAILHFLGLGGVHADESAANPGSVLTSEISRLNNESLFWGPYKPNLYFGVRPRTPNGLWTGLMWANVNNFQDVQKGMLGVDVQCTPWIYR